MALFWNGPKTGLKKYYEESSDSWNSWKYGSDDAPQWYYWRRGVYVCTCTVYNMIYIFLLLNSLSRASGMCTWFKQLTLIRSGLCIIIIINKLFLFGMLAGSSLQDPDCGIQQKALYHSQNSAQALLGWHFSLSLSLLVTCHDKYN